MAQNNFAALMPLILSRSLLHLREQVRMPRLVNSDYSSEAAEKGDTIDVKIPQARNASAVTPSNTSPDPAEETPVTVQVPLDQWYHSDFKLSDKDMKEIATREHFVPMQTVESVRALANQVNQHLMSQYVGIYGFVGTPGTTPFNATTKTTDAINARKVLHQQLCPRDMRRAVMDYDSEANALALDAFADASQAGENLVKIEGEIGRKFGIDWYTDDHVPTHTAGTITTGLSTKAATSQAVGLKSVVCTTAASTGACALKQGDIITFAGDSQTYVLTADATEASAATDVTLSIEPGLKVAKSGGEAVTVKGDHVANLVFHPNAFAFAMRPLASGDSARGLGNEIMSMQDPATGIVLRLEVSRQFKQTVWDLDILWGSKLVRPELACRIAG